MDNFTLEIKFLWSKINFWSNDSFDWDLRDVK